jgi:hypothetical protein
MRSAPDKLAGTDGWVAGPLYRCSAGAQIWAGLSDLDWSMPLAYPLLFFSLPDDAGAQLRSCRRWCGPGNAGEHATKDGQKAFTRAPPFSVVHTPGPLASRFAESGPKFNLISCLSKKGRT